MFIYSIWNNFISSYVIWTNVLKSKSLIEFRHLKNIHSNLSTNIKYRLKCPFPKFILLYHLLDTYLQCRPHLKHWNSKTKTGLYFDAPPIGHTSQKNAFTRADESPPPHPYHSRCICFTGSQFGSTESSSRATSKSFNSKLPAPTNMPAS